MASSSDGVRCTVHDGEVWVHIDSVQVHIPSRLLRKSQILMDALASVRDSSVTRRFTLAAPTEWLKAWVACFVSEEAYLSDADSKVLVSCLIVCFCP
jgi:hypothetical protein